MVETSSLSGDITNEGEANYYFASNYDPDNGPQVELNKYWQNGHQTLPIARFENFQDALNLESKLVDLKEDYGLETAVQASERHAVANGLLDPNREDSRLFTAGPPDPFKSLQQVEIEATNYTYDIVEQAQGTFELQSIKTWQRNGVYETQSLLLGDYDRSQDARNEQQTLLDLREQSGLQAEMREVERIAVENGSLMADRPDARLFTQGPPDTFTTQREIELESGMGYYFRAGSVVEHEPEIEAHSLNLVHVERNGSEFTLAQVEIMRVEAQDADYVTDAAQKFNHMLHEEGTGPSVAAATTWAREHGAEPSLDWQEVNIGQLDPRYPSLNFDKDVWRTPLLPSLDMDR
ncbi:MAG: hypothetical protein RLP44_29675 [Aggregatilineales bacterium]